MKIIHQNGYSAEDLARHRHTIYKNLMDSIKSVIGAMYQFELMPENPENEDNFQFLYDYEVSPDPNVCLDPKVAPALTAVWTDPVVKKMVLERSNEFYVMDSAP